MNGGCRVHKKRKKKKNAAVRPRMIGFGAVFVRELRRFAVPVSVGAVIYAVGAALAAALGTVTAYAVFYISAAALCAVIAVTAAGGTVNDTDKPETALSGVAPADRIYVRAGTVTTAKCVSVLIASGVSAVIVLGGALMLFSPQISGAAALSFLSAAYYVTVAACVTSAAHDPRKKKGRRRFILGFASVYTVGLLALMLIFASASAIPLGEDFTGDTIPAGTVLALSLLYLTATLLRSVYLYFILRRRLRVGMKLR